MSGTDLAYGATTCYAMSGTDLAYGATTCYAMAAYGATRAAPSTHKGGGSPRGLVGGLRVRIQIQIVWTQQGLGSRV
eukprot:1450712-Rhodomonas_salina.1